MDIPYYLKRDFLDSEDLQKVLCDLEKLNNPESLLSGDKTHPARDTEGVILKQNKGLFLDDSHAELVPSLFQATVGNKDNDMFITEYCKKSPVNRVLNYGAEIRGMLLSYYENSDYYAEHIDITYATVLMWFYREPKRFMGGDLTFGDTGEVIECRNNSLIMFPGWALHSVDPIKLEPQHRDQKLGRYCITLFMHPRKYEGFYNFK